MPTAPSTVDLHRLDASTPDARDLAGYLALLESCRRVDGPHAVPLTRSFLRADLVHGWDGEPGTVDVHRDATGRVVGAVGVSTSARDNLHVAQVDVCVHPDVRRRGLGRRLAAAGVQQARELGRTTVWFEHWDNPATLAFAAALGMSAGTVSVNRRQDLAGFPPDRAATIVAEARPHAAGYELVRIPSPVPEELVVDVLRLLDAMNDSPRDDLDLEDEIFDLERLRAFEAARAAHDERMYHLAARHRASGELAGHTMVAVHAEQPWHAEQMDTSVVASHRGHRLGLLLKGAMLQWLAESEPQLLEIDTWNARSNDHMIAVNDRLGYHVLAESTTFQLRLPTT